MSCNFGFLGFRFGFGFLATMFLTLLYMLFFLTHFRDLNVFK